MDVIKWDGGKITRPGIYVGIPLDRYHSPICDGPEISSSGLRKIVLQSPLHFWADSYLNPNREEEDPQAAESVYMRVGRAAHCLMLEPQKFHRLYTKRPDEYPDWRTTASREWRQQAISRGWTVLSDDEWDQIEGIAVALNEHRWHRDGILSGLVEASIIARDKKTGIWMKSRPDAVPLDNAITDMKITTSAHPDDVARSVKNLGYDMQMALAGITMQLVTGRAFDQFWLVFIEAKKPHAIHVASLSLNQIFAARIRIRHGLDVMARCLKENYWPAYGLDGLEVGPTEWEWKKLEADQKGGLLPLEDQF